MAWTDELFDTLDLDETAAERRLRHAACLLADIGWRAHPDYRGEQSVNIIANAAFIGLDHPGRAYLALANYFRHEGLSIEKASATLKNLATPRLIMLARVLGGAFRVAYPVSVAMDGVLPKDRADRPDLLEGDEAHRAQPPRRHGRSRRRAALRPAQAARQGAGARAEDPGGVKAAPSRLRARVVPARARVSRNRATASIPSNGRLMT